jgi:hypothetical protein
MLRILAPDEILGEVDECRPEHEVGFIDSRSVLLRGERVRIGGWAYRVDGAAVDVEVVVDGRRAPAVSGFVRHDVAIRHGAIHAQSGFGAVVDVGGPPFGPIDPEVICRSHGREVRLPSRTGLFRVSEPVTDIALDAGRAIARIRRVADADPRPHHPGWSGRRTIRPGSPIEVSGWALDEQGSHPSAVFVMIRGRDVPVRCFPAALRADGEAISVTGGSAWFPAGFACAIAPDQFPPGLYEASVVVRDGGGRCIPGPSEAFQVVEDGDPRVPAHLPVGAMSAPGQVERCEPREVVRGTPVAVEGWAIDPATRRGSDVFVAFDDYAPLPIPSGLARTHVRSGEDSRIGFAGIADTGGLAAGEHRLRLLMRPVYAGFWHLVGEYTVRVRDV